MIFTVRAHYCAKTCNYADYFTDTKLCFQRVNAEIARTREYQTDYGSNTIQ